MQSQRDATKLEKEIKLPVLDISSALAKIRSVGKYIRTDYIRDVIYGTKEDKKKIRLRVEDNFEFRLVDVTHKYKIAVDNGIRNEIEETLYKGNSYEDALKIISSQGDFFEENSYEKIRVIFAAPHEVEIVLDLYPFGVWIEVEGEESRIHEVAKKLGFSQKDYIEHGADELYLQWVKKNSFQEKWDIRFGLTGDK